MKKIVSIPLDTISLYDLEEKLDEISVRMQAYINKHFEQYSNLRLVKEPVPYEDYDQYVLYGDALETDKQYEKRIKEEKYFQKMKEKSERKQFEELKKKYGN